MMHIQRDEQGNIIGLLQRPLTEHEAASGQWLPADSFDPGEPVDPALTAFARSLAAPAASNPLAQTDTDLARVTEDLIDVLIDRGVIQFTDLPVGAQNKLLQRRQTRATLANRLNLLGGDDII